MMSRKVFGFSSLVILFVLSHVYSFFKFHFSGLEELQAQIVALKTDLKKEQLKTALARNELQDFQQNVALLIPEEKLKSSYQLRNLASVVEAPSKSDLPVDFGKSLFLSGKAAFKNNEYEESNELFRQVLKDYSSSPYVIESYFLLIEGLYKTKEFDTCLSEIESMITLFPEHELSGFAMLRLGSIFQMRDRLEEAVEVYRTVLKQFSSNDVLQKQARVLISQVEI